jgi:hypothetical protein
MNFSGIILGLVAFLCIGVFHPLVIKGGILFRNQMLVGICIGRYTDVGRFSADRKYLYFRHIRRYLFFLFLVYT